MDDDTERVARLAELGLPATCARAYIALLQLGTSEARAVSELAGIRPAKVYATLEQLQARGLAEVALGKPRRYTPVPMAEFIARRMSEQRAMLAALDAKRDELVELFPIEGTAQAPARARLSAVTGRRNVVQQLRNAIREATRDIFVTDPSTDCPEVDDALRRSLVQASERGVRVCLVPAPAEAERAALTAAFPGSDLDGNGAASNAGALIATFDGTLAIFASVRPVAGTNGRAKDTAVCTSEPAVVAQLRTLLSLRCVDAAQSVTAR